MPFERKKLKLEVSDDVELVDQSQSHSLDTALKLYEELLTSDPLTDGTANINQFERKALLRKCHFNAKEAYEQVRLGKLMNYK